MTEELGPAMEELARVAEELAAVTEDWLIRQRSCPPATIAGFRRRNCAG
jgi:hypothetical protein